MPNSEKKLFCTEDIAHDEFYLEEAVTKSYRLNAKKEVVDEAEYGDDPDTSENIRCFHCGSPVVDWTRAAKLKSSLLQLLYGLLKKDAAYSKDPEVRKAVEEFMMILVDRGLFLKRSINEKIPMKALLSKYGLTRSVVDYCKTRKAKEEKAEARDDQDRRAENM